MTRFDLPTTTVGDCRREIDRLRTELDMAHRERDSHLRALDGGTEAKLARVRELCHEDWSRTDPVHAFRRDVLRALDGGTE